MKMVWLSFLLAAQLLLVLGTSLKRSQAAVPWHEQKYHHRPKSLTTARISSISGLSDVERLKRVELNPLLIKRVPGTAGVRQARQHIIDRLELLGITVEVDTFTERAPNGDDIEFVNIIGTVNPSAKRKLVLACHYDSKNDTGFIGAIDSAVPCAMILDIAYTLNPYLKNSNNNDLTLQLIFFDGEEAFETWTDTDSLYGARHLAKLMSERPYPYAESSTSMLDGIDVLVLLDLLGTPSPIIYSQFENTSGLFLRLNSLEKKLAKEGLLESHSKNHNEYFLSSRSFPSGAVEDDHIPFLRRDVPILHLIPLPFPDVWHKQSDNERALDYPTIDNLSKILRVFVFEYLHLNM